MRGTGLLAAAALLGGLSGWSWLLGSGGPVPGHPADTLQLGGSSVAAYATVRNPLPARRVSGEISARCAVNMGFVEYYATPDDFYARMQSEDEDNWEAYVKGMLTPGTRVHHLDGWLLVRFEVEEGERKGDIGYVPTECITWNER